MIVGLGEDLVEISRIAALIETKGDAFLSKCFTSTEIAAAQNHKTNNRIHAYYAKRFAAKEACLKALGTGMRAGIGWHDMQVGNDELGRPHLGVSGGVLERLNDIAHGAKTAIHITLSDEAGLAKATVILESLSTQ